MTPLVVVDLDDTLYLERDFVRSGFEAVGDEVRERLGIAGFFEIAWGRFLEGRRGRIFDEALAALGIEPAPDLIGDLVTCYRTHPPKIALMPDAVRLLARSDCRFALITDGPEVMQRGKIAALGLEQCCHPVVCTDAWGIAYRKPHPRGFEAIAEFHELPPRDVTFIADNPAKDFVTPRRLGWRTIRIRRRGGLYGDLEAPPGADAELTITDLDQLT